jgi:hypothetical protein
MVAHLLGGGPVWPLWVTGTLLFGGAVASMAVPQRLRRACLAVSGAGIMVWGCCGDQFERQSGMWLEPAEIRGAFLSVHAVPVRLLIDRGGRAHPLPAARVTRLGDSNVSARVTCSVLSPVADAVILIAMIYSARPTRRVWSGSPFVSDIGLVGATGPGS